jgi:hypothetical protein
MNNKELYVLMNIAKQNHQMKMTVSDFIELNADFFSLAEERETFVFPWLGKPISQMSDDAVIAWLISFLNGADVYDEVDIRMYEIFSLDRKFRSAEFNHRVDYLLEVI